MSYLWAGRVLRAGGGSEQPLAGQLPCGGHCTRTDVALGVLQELAGELGHLRGQQRLSEAGLPWGSKQPQAAVTKCRVHGPALLPQGSHDLGAVGCQGQAGPQTLCSPPQRLVIWVRNSRPESLTSQQGLHRRFCSTASSSGAGGQLRGAHLPPPSPSQRPPPSPHPAAPWPPAQPPPRLPVAPPPPPPTPVTTPHAPPHCCMPLGSPGGRGQGLPPRTSWAQGSRSQQPGGTAELSSQRSVAWKAFFRTWGSRAGRGEPAPAPPSALCARPALGCAMGTACRGRGGLGPASVRQEPLEEVDRHQHETEKKAALLGTPGSGDRRDHQGLFLKACRLTPPTPPPAQRTSH